MQDWQGRDLVGDEEGRRSVLKMNDAGWRCVEAAQAGELVKIRWPTKTVWTEREAELDGVDVEDDRERRTARTRWGGVGARRGREG